MWVFLKVMSDLVENLKFYSPYGSWNFSAGEVPIDLDIYRIRTFKASEICPLVVYIELNYSGFLFQHLLFYLNSLIESYENTGSVFSNKNAIELPWVSPTEESLLPAGSLGVKVMGF